MSNKCDNHTALNKTFNESDSVGQLVSRFHCIINFGTQIVSLKKSHLLTTFGTFHELENSLRMPINGLGNLTGSAI